MKPQIVITFGPVNDSEDECVWHSVGWGTDAKLMKQAREAINKGNTPDEVRELLKKHFDIVEL